MVVRCSNTPLYFMRNALFILLALCIVQLHAQVKTVTDDREWAKSFVALKNTSEAEYIIRLGDVDNLGFGWPEGFDPFCGHMTQAHAYPWDVDPNEQSGFDRILLSSKFRKDAKIICLADGYAESADAKQNKPSDFVLALNSIQNVEIKNAFLQLFIDDFQAPIFCSKFTITINGKRFIEAEKFLNAIEQTGPVGKLISIPIPEEFYPDLAKNEITLRIDESTGAHDGFALDFMRILINRKRENSCKGSIHGNVLDRETQEPIANANVSLADKTTATANQQGLYSIKNIPTGLEIISASAPGYADGYTSADIIQGQDHEATIYLTRSKTKAKYDNKPIAAGETITLNAILFDQGKADLREASKAELEKIVSFLKAYPNAEIELAGHTSSEGDRALNKSLSYKRVKACKDFIVGKGIDEGRIISVGYGPDRPVAPNDTEANREKNRRAEMRVLKL